MGRRRRGKTIETKLLLPEAVYLELEKRLTNNFQTKPIYGARSQLITELIVKYLETPPLQNPKKEPSNV